MKTLFVAGCPDCDQWDCDQPCVNLDENTIILIKQVFNNPINVKYDLFSVRICCMKSWLNALGVASKIQVAFTSAKTSMQSIW